MPPRIFPQKPRRPPTQSPSVTSETSAGCIPHPRVPHRSHQCPPNRNSSTKLNLCGLRDLCAMHSPSASSRTEATSVHPIAFVHQAQSLCDLRDLCAMHSPIRVFPRRSHECPPKRIRPPSSISVTSETSVRCFPPFASSRTEATSVHPIAFVSTKLNLCGLRDLCAMHSPFREFRHRSHECPPNRIRPPSSIPSVTSETSVRCIPHFACSRTESRVFTHSPEVRRRGGWLHLEE